MSIRLSHLHRASALTLGLLVVSCAQSQSQGQKITHVVIGDSMASGYEAAQELQLAINRAQTVGCEAISIGGYGAGGEGMNIGLAALMSCPGNIDLIPTGFAFDQNGQQIPVDPAAVLPPSGTP